MTADTFAKDAVRNMSNFVNGGNRWSSDTFIELMGQEHRTLQQSFTALCLKWLRHLSKVEHFDARNEASVKVAKKICSKMDEDIVDDPYWDELPLI